MLYTLTSFKSTSCKEPGSKLDLILSVPKQPESSHVGGVGLWSLRCGKGRK